MSANVTGAMGEGRRLPVEGWLPLAAGLLWLAWVGGAGIGGLVLALLPGGLLVGSGVSMLLWPGDRRIAQCAALGGFAGALLAWIAMPIAGLSAGLVLLVASLAVIPAAGRHALRSEPRYDGVPDPLPSVAVSAQAAVDDAILAGLVLSLPPASVASIDLRDEFARATRLFEDRGWLDDPVAYHRMPPPLENPTLRERESRGRRFEHLVFESEYEPFPEEPGRERSLASRRNRRAHAWLLRHPEGPRPWLVCIHGYGMGAPAIDLPAFGAAWLHERLGLNVIFPVLPHHGPRSGGGGRSGRRFFSADFFAALHSQAQAVWDIRRLLSWVRAQGASSVGAYGLSMGGHVAALLASVESDLDCVICGIPVADLSRLAWRHAPPSELRRFEELGLHHAEALLRPVSPLQLTPRVPHASRFLFGGTADRLVPPDQLRDLWLHWDKPRLAWYQGSHMAFGLDPDVRRLVKDGVVSLLDESREHRNPSLRLLFSG